MTDPQGFELSSDVFRFNTQEGLLEGVETTRDFDYGVAVETVKRLRLRTERDTVYLGLELWFAYLHLKDDKFAGRKAERWHKFFSNSMWTGSGKEQTAVYQWEGKSMM